ncbi:MAG: cupin, partial [Gemmobacter sp.]
MQLLQRIDRSAVTPVEERPDPEKVISGDPVHTTWSIEEADGLYSGMWQATPGKWKVSYDGE